MFDFYRQALLKGLCYVFCVRLKIVLKLRDFYRQRNASWT